MERQHVLRRRLATQRLTSAPLPRAADAVRLLTCVQSQQRDHALFSLALRTKTRTYAGVRAELDAGAFLRTHILRPTWHFVAPQDLGWILAVTSPRVESSMTARHRQLQLDDDRVVGAALDLLMELLRDKTFRTRSELGEALAQHQSPVRAGEQLGHLLLIAELRGLICSGPTKGGQHSYALVDEVIAPTRERSREEALAELARRFFTSHGPASIKDFTRWSSLSTADAKAALSQVGGDLERVDVDGVSHWCDGNVPRRSPASAPAYLFPVYDEVVLSYPTVSFPVAQGHPNQGLRDQWWAPVVCDETNAGMWKRSVGPSSVAVTVRLTPGVRPGPRTAIEAAAQRLADFHERALHLVVDDEG